MTSKVRQMLFGIPKRKYTWSKTYGRESETRNGRNIFNNKGFTARSTDTVHFARHFTLKSHTLCGRSLNPDRDFTVKKRGIFAIDDRAYCNCRLCLKLL